MVVIRPDMNDLSLDKIQNCRSHLYEVLVCSLKMLAKNFTFDKKMLYYWLF